MIRPQAARVAHQQHGSRSSTGPMRGKLGSEFET